MMVVKFRRKKCHSSIEQTRPPKYPFWWIDRDEWSSYIMIICAVGIGQCYIYVILPNSSCTAKNADNRVRAAAVAQYYWNNLVKKWKHVGHLNLQLYRLQKLILCILPLYALVQESGHNFLLNRRHTSFRCEHTHELQVLLGELSVAYLAKTKSNFSSLHYT